MDKQQPRWEEKSVNYYREKWTRIFRVKNKEFVIWKNEIDRVDTSLRQCLSKAITQIMWVVIASRQSMALQSFD